MPASSIVRSMRFPRSKGNLAIDPKAMDVEWSFEGPPQSEPEMFSDIALVHIRGPMVHHCEWWFESYDEIVQRMRTAFYSEQSRCVFVEGDTPGGDVSGLFDTAAELDRLQDETGKLLYWYVDGQTCSAGVGLAVTARGGIFIPAEGVFGSIGVIAEIQNFREAAEKSGVKTFLLTSGQCKADGHPFAKVDDGMLERIQAGVDYEANIFHEWVSSHRNVSVEAVRDLQAGIVRGQQAIDAGLADELSTFSAALAMVAGAELEDAPEGATGENNMAGLDAKGRPVATSAANTASKKSLEDARKMLGEIAAEDSDEGRRARKMLDEADADEEPADKKDDKEPDGDEGEGDEDGDDAEDDSDGDDATAASATAAEGDDEGDDAKRADSEEASAKKAEDDAAKAEDESDGEARKAAKAKALAESKSHAAAALKLRNKAKSLRKAAAQHRSNAKLYRSNAAVHARLKAVETRTGKRVATSLPTNPAVAALGAKGTTGKGQANKSNVLSLAAVSPQFRAAARLGKAAGSGRVQMDMSGIGMDPDTDLATAQKLLAEMEGTG